MIEIRESSVSELLLDGRDLFVEHWQEIALSKGVMVVKPDEERYFSAEVAGNMLNIGAYQDGVLVGYSVNFVVRHLHYADLIVCQNDLLFLTQEMRRSRLGLRLIHETERLAKDRGARLMLWHSKEGTALASIMPKIGYRVHDIVFSKEI